MNRYNLCNIIDNYLCYIYHVELITKLRELTTKQMLKILHNLHHIAYKNYKKIND